MADVLILGAGGFGTALAVMLDSAGHSVNLWGRSPQKNEQLRLLRENRPLLPGVVIPESITVTDNLCAAGSCEFAIIATASAGVRETARRLCGRLSPGCVVACVAKGFEPDSLKLMEQIIKEELPRQACVIISGPSHAEEVAADMPTALVAASGDPVSACRVQELTEGTRIRIYTSSDVLGVQLGGALKNVIAFAMGVVEGLGLGDNTKAALMTRGLTEITRLATAMGARPETLAGLAGVGDLAVTCFSRHSRNRRCGMLVGQGKSLDEAVGEVGMTVEGVSAALCAGRLAGIHNVEMPITELTVKLIEGNIDAARAVTALLARPQRNESERHWLDG
jgi:glycerol-3-phosphate dehydrogenase (NAD(P)+)